MEPLCRRRTPKPFCDVFLFSSHHFRMVLRNRRFPLGKTKFWATLCPSSAGLRAPRKPTETLFEHPSCFTFLDFGVVLCGHIPLMTRTILRATIARKHHSAETSIFVPFSKHVSTISLNFFSHFQATAASEKTLFCETCPKSNENQ